MNSAVVSRVLTLSQAPILLHPGFRNEFGVLVRNAVAAFVVGLGIVRGPPVAQISVLIKLASLVVVPVDGLVTNHRASSRVVDRIVLRRIEERRVQNSSRKVDGGGLRILIRIHRGRGPPPFSSIQRLANLLELAVHFECRGTLYVNQMIVSRNFQ